MDVCQAPDIWQTPRYRKISLLEISMRPSNSKNVVLDKKPLWFLCAALLVLSVASYGLNQDIPPLLSGVHQIMHPKRQLFLEYVVIFSFIVNIVFVNIILFKFKYLLNQIFTIGFSLNVSILVFSLVCFFIDRRDVYIGADEERLIAAILCIFNYIFLLEKYQEAKKETST